jgi:hypothetical protein
VKGAPAAAAIVPYSLEAYRSLIERALHQGYRFGSFLDADDAGGKGRIYLRHDVDFSLDAAVELANLNASLQVVGTFFVLLRSDIYNLLSPRALAQVRRLRSLGQLVALHYARGLEPLEGPRLARAVTTDFELVRSSLPDLQPVFSWHNPTPEMIRHGLGLVVPGLVNAYGPRFLDGARYYSDSNLRYSVSELLDLFVPGPGPSLHLLLHPINWVIGGTSVTDILAGAWKRVLREREEGMRSNRVYAETFPAGMPKTLIDGFASEWLREATSVPSPSATGNP